MRAPTALEARSSRIWRVAVGTIVVCTGAAIGTWCATAGDVVSPWVRAVVAVVAFALASAAVRMAAAVPSGLRWTGHEWELLPPGSAEPVRGIATVALDLGGWMLLRFVTEGSGRVAWLPAERRGDPSGWHALRCALYSAHGGRR